MSEARQKPPPCYSAVYAAALYPDLVAIARQHGYALAAHGSLQRDFDLVAIPWTAAPSSPAEVLAEITERFAVRLVGTPVEKEHGRLAYLVSIGHGECAIDLSFMPLRQAA